MQQITARSAKAVRPLSIEALKNPAWSSYWGAFHNVSFQIGAIVRLQPEAEPVGMPYIPASINKGALPALPLRLPPTLQIGAGVTKTIACVIGEKCNGDYDAILVARNNEPPSAFDQKPETVDGLLAKMASNEEGSEDGDSDPKFKDETHNQVFLAGMVVAAEHLASPSPRMVIYIRQDENNHNVIKLVYKRRNASALVSKLEYGSLIWARGKLTAKQVPLYKLDEAGDVLIEAGKKVVELDSDNKPKTRLHTYVEIERPTVAKVRTRPSDSDEDNYPIDFKKTNWRMPAWMAEIGREIAKARARKIPQQKSAS